MQTEKAFQKQEGVFLNSKKLQAKKTSAGVRFYKKIGLGKHSPPVRPGNAPSANSECLTKCRLQDPPDRH